MDADAAPRPLSFAQERIWLRHQLGHGAAAASLVQAVDLSGALDPALLGRAVGEVVRRHEILRTTFTAPAGVPAATVWAEPILAPAARRPLPLVDLAGLSDAAREAEVARLAAGERRRPFDLARGPLLRLAVVRLAERRHAVLLAAHPIVLDGGSSALLWREVAALYAAFAAGRPSPLPDLAARYSDYALWQRRPLAGEALAAQVDFWRGELAPPLPVLRLPADFDRASAPGYLPGEARRALPAPLAAALRALGERRGAAPAEVLLAAFAALLARYSGEEEMLIGTPVAGRPRPDFAALIGPFQDTLLLRLRPRLDRGFGPLVDEAREAAARAGAHRSLPLARVLAALDLPRAPFQAAFAWHDLPAPRLSFAGLALAARPDLSVDPAGETCELGLAATADDLEIAGGLRLQLAYDARLFAAATAARLLAHLEALLAAALAAPERPLAELSLLAEAERQQLLAWSDGGALDAPCSLEPPPLAHRAILAQAARTPEAPAVVAMSDGRETSYGELARLAGVLARRLAARGIGPESRVAIALERSPRMVAALLAVLAAGGAYVPLDPAHPVERLALILGDVGAAALLAGGGSAAARAAAELARVPVVDLDLVWPEIEREPAGEPFAGPPVDRESLAYVIYTSGSTGAPKGVMIRHGGLASYVLAARRDLALTPADRVLQFASLSFDASAEEIFCCLASGASLVLRNDAVLAGAPAFLGACASRGVTVCDLPTAFWQELVDRVDAGEAAWPPSLRLLVTGGERALPERVARLRRQLGPAVRVLNSYGPTEITVAATSHSFHGEPDGPPRPLRELPIGRPLAGARAYVLPPLWTQARELCPPGIPGELYLGGEAVARGYLGRPDLTAAAFLPDPFAGRPGARMYATGDLARIRPDAGSDAGADAAAGGELEYLGRIDRQVKLRGFRIELAEVEGALARHPAVAETAAAVDERCPGERALLAWWAARPGAHATAAELRGFLKERLPEPMVPSLFVLLPALPRGAGGKVDRRALPAPAPEAAAAGGFEAPATPAEEAVAAIWRELLGASRAGRQDDFFALGGRSLLLPRVRHRLEQELGVQLPLASLLERTTVAAVALAVEEHLVSELEAELAAAR